jgi:DNA-binding LacI/PurR family transcriptional regulator
MAVTINDIAKKAKVSKATISLVLNMKPGVGQAMRDKIFTIAEEMGYKLKKNSAIKINNLKTICFLRIAKHGRIINPSHKVFIADYIDGLEKESQKNGYKLEIRSFENFDSEAIISSLDTTAIAGIVVLSTELDESDLDLFKTIPIPIVFIDSYHSYHNFDFVDMDNETSIFTVVRHFVEQGHTRIGLVKGSIETRNFRLREQSFIESLNRFNLRLKPEDCFSIDSTYEKGSEDMSNLIRNRRDFPSALFCVNDIIAYGCIKALSDAGYTIPDDISIIGFDDLPSNEYMNPPLTSIKVSKHAIGSRALQLLAMRIKHPDRPAEKTVIGGELVIRKSVKNIIKQFTESETV